MRVSYELKEDFCTICLHHLIGQGPGIFISETIQDMEIVTVEDE